MRYSGVKPNNSTGQPVGNTVCGDVSNGSMHSNGAHGYLQKYPRFPLCWQEDDSNIIIVVNLCLYCQILLLSKIENGGYFGEAKLSMTQLNRPESKKRFVSCQSKYESDYRGYMICSRENKRKMGRFMSLCSKHIWSVDAQPQHIDL